MRLGLVETEEEMIFNGLLRKRSCCTNLNGQVLILFCFRTMIFVKTRRFSQNNHVREKSVPKEYNFQDYILAILTKQPNKQKTRAKIFSPTVFNKKNSR